MISQIAVLKALKGDDAARALIVRAVLKAKGNRRDAAEALGVSSATLYRAIGELDLWGQLDDACEKKGFRTARGRARGKMEPGARV